MRLSQMRAGAVHNALLRTGKVTEQRLDTRWTGERQATGAPVAPIGPSDRAVEIAVH